MEKRNALGGSKKPAILWILIAVVAVAAILIGVAIMIPKQQETVQIVRTQTQGSLDSLLESIASDPNLTEPQKQLLTQVLSSLDGEGIQTMDDAVLVMEKLLESDLLNAEEKEIFTSLLSRIRSGEVGDLLYVKSILTNILDNVRSRILSEVAAETITGGKLYTLIDQIRNDDTLSAEQKELYIHILKIIDEKDLCDVSKFTEVTQVQKFISNLLKDDIVADPDMKALLESILAGMKDGQNYDIAELRQIIDLCVNKKLQNSFLSEEKKALLQALLDEFGARIKTLEDMNAVEDAKNLISRIVDSGLVKDEVMNKELQDLLNRINSGDNTLTIEEIRSTLSRIVENLTKTLMSEKSDYLNEQNNQGLGFVTAGGVTNSYMDQFINEYYNSYNQLQDLANLNADNINELMNRVSQNESLSEEEKKRLAEALDSYKNDNDAALKDAASQLQALIDSNADMDESTKKALMDLI
ncbi:MAG: hypothetical protein IKM88_04890, partial [Lachnospiraceae bacterium]|nr:hypothetical protein [Lachnospiraceae bacterium]